MEYHYIHNEVECPEGIMVTVQWLDSEDNVIVTGVRVVTGDVESFIPAFAGELRERHSELFIVTLEEEVSE